jgi:DNA replication protein DnaC
MPSMMDELRARFPHLDFDTPGEAPTGHPRVTRDEQAAQALEQHARRAPAEFRNAQASRPEVIAWADRYTARTLDGRTGLLLLGRTGTGKTHEAYGALRRIAASGHSRPGWYGGLVSELYSRFRGGGDADFEFTVAADAPILLLDDIGAAKESPWTEETVHRLVDHRYAERLPVVVTGNLTYAELAAKVGERVASRLAGMCTVVKFEGDDMRRRRP